MKKWLLLAFASLVVAVGLVAAVGFFLPRGHVASRRVHLSTSPERVWETITDFAAVPTWWDGIQKAERAGEKEGKEVWHETFKHGEQVEIINTEVVPLRKMVRTIPPQNLLFYGSWTYEVEAAPDGGSLVTITEKGEVPNPIFRALSYFFFDQRATIDSYIKALALKLEVEAHPAETIPAGP